MLRSRRDNLLALLLWAGVATLAVGFFATRMWHNIPIGRARESATLGLIVLLLAAMVVRVARLQLSNAMLLLWGVGLVLLVGPVPCAAVALLALSAIALGGLLVPTSYGRSVLLPLVAGIALMVGTIGWTLPFPLHYRAVYLAVLLLPIAFRRRDLADRLRTTRAAWQRLLRESPKYSAIAVMIVGVTSTGCWVPSLQFDDLGYHLGMPSQLAALGYYRMDFFSQVWALAPWAGDIVQSIAQVIARHEARGAVDALWLLASAALVWRLSATLNIPAYGRWLATGLYASLPLLFALVGGMHAELPATAVMLALALAVAEAPELPDARAFCLVSALAALLLEIKTGFAAATVPMGIWLLWRWRGRVPYVALLPSVGLLILVAGSCYVYAYCLSGNPMLPLMNATFHSPYVPPGNFTGTQFYGTGGLTMPWEMTFHTATYIGGWDGAAGVSFLGLLGASAAALFMPRMRPLALVATVAFLVPFEAIKYYRYAFPALVLMIPVTVATTVVLLSRRNASVLLTAVMAVNLLFQGCTYYAIYHQTFLRDTLYSREQLFERELPERVMAKFIRDQSTTDAALFCDPLRPFSIELVARGFTVSPYDTELYAAFLEAENDPTGEAWRALFARTGVRYAVTNTERKSAALSLALSNATKVRAISTIELWHLPAIAGAAGSGDLARSRDVAAAHFHP